MYPRAWPVSFVSPEVNKSSSKIDWFNYPVLGDYNEVNLTLVIYDLVWGFSFWF
jgi:hypothetical protein